MMQPGCRAAGLKESSTRDGCAPCDPKEGPEDLWGSATVQEHLASAASWNGCKW